MKKKAVKSNAPKLIEKLRTQNKRLETILHISPAAFMIARAKDRALTEVNEAWSTMLGYPAAELINQTDGLGRLFRDNGAISAILRTLDSGGDIANLRCYLHDKDNKPRIVQLYATRFEEAGEAYYLFNFCDLTEALGNEKTVLAYDQKIRNLERALDASSLISVTDAQGMIIYANVKFCEVSEYTRDELLGQNHRIVNSGYHSADFMRNLWQTISAGKVWHGEIRNRKKGGGLYWVQSTIIPFIDKNGTPYQYYAIRQEISEHKLFQEKLMRTQAALMQAQELAHIGTWEWYPETDNPLWSPELFRIFRLEPGASSIGLGAFKNFATEKSYRALEKAIQHALETGEAFNTECEVVRADKTLAWVVIAGLPLHDDRGKISGLRGSVQDITERKLIEEKNRLIVSALPDLIFILSRDGIFLDFHASDLQRLALPPEQFLGKNAEAIFPPELANRMAGVIRRVADSEQKESMEYSLAMPSGTAYFEALFSPLDDRRIIVVVRDVTAKRKADEQMREQAVLLDRAQDAIMVRSLDHVVQYWNQGAERIYGWSREEAIGKSARELLYEDHTICDAAFAELMEKREFNGELTQVTKDKRSIVVQVRWTVVFDEMGRPKSVLAINSDITERKKLEQQFLRAQRLESIGTLAGGIAHDLNNVLTPIMLAIEVLKMGQLSEDQKELIETIALSARRGAGMVKQVLSFARGVEGNPAPMQVTHLLADIEKIIRDTFPKNISLVINIPKDLWSIRGDKTQLHQVILNIAVNARDAMDDGGELLLAAENHTVDAQYAAMYPGVLPGKFVGIRIEDSGEGMSPEVLEKIFEPFFTTKEQGKGTGLGLSTSIGIVKGHGGFIRAYSEPGKGTRFHIYLPALLSSQDAVAEKAEQALPRGEGEWILVVDDEAPVRNVTRQTLEAFGYRVKTAADGAEAIAVYAAAKNDIRLMLTDMMMPVLDGLGTIQVIRKMDPNLPIIAASGLEANGKTARLAGEGVKFFLSKPYSADVLLKTIRQALTKNP